MFSIIGALVTEADGDIIVVEAGSDYIFRVDPLSGDRTTLSGLNGFGTGPDFSNPQSIAINAAGDIFVTNRFFFNAVYHVDPVTGDRTVISDSATGLGPMFSDLRGIAIVAVPEPSTLFLLCFGAVGFLVHALCKSGGRN